jgi:hypothetical protein
MNEIPGTVAPAVARLRWVRKEDVNNCRVYEVQAPDGYLRALVSQDAAGPHGEILWHLSVTHWDHFKTPDRCPTWDELKHARYTLIQADVPMVIIFPRRRAKYVNIHDTCLHLWESLDTTVDQ